MTPILVPALGNEITEAEVTEWLVAEGATVAEGDAVVTITTTKMAIDIEAPASGTLTRIAIPEGELAQVGAILGEIA
jgi:pyruvate/2-oxoglutarate dehydrogenase complex dihydrolipoamide acyltransferase (E2) component